MLLDNSDHNSGGGGGNSSSTGSSSSVGDDDSSGGGIDVGDNDDGSMGAYMCMGYKQGLLSLLAVVVEACFPVKSDRAQSNDPVKSDRAQSKIPVKSDRAQTNVPVNQVTLALRVVYTLWVRCPPLQQYYHPSGTITPSLSAAAPFRLYSTVPFIILLLAPLFVPYRFSYPHPNIATLITYYSFYIIITPQSGTADVFVNHSKAVFPHTLALLRFWCPEVFATFCWRSFPLSLFALPWVTTLFAGKYIPVKFPVKSDLAHLNTPVKSVLCVALGHDFVRR